MIVEVDSVGSESSMFLMQTRCGCILLAATIGLWANPAAAAEPARAGPDWWSLQKIRNPVTPMVRQADWVKNPIDAFILAQLEAKGLKPAPAADARTLIRRVTFDLIGLPPTPEEIDAFAKAYAATPHAAYEALTDRLLASPHYGERWARHWLDAVRFSESHGFEYDRLREHAWRYRDYVIQSLNDDKPYARFVTEQLAGDALAPLTREGIIATGFLTAGPWDQAGHGAVSPTVRAKAREDEMEEILAAVGQTFLGLTINCARCHDHKFDPLTAKDYYRMKAVFDGVWHGDRALPNTAETREAQAAVEKIRARISELEGDLAEIEKRGRAKAINADDRKHDAKDLPQPVSQWTFDGDSRDRIGGLHGSLKGAAVIKDGRLLLNGKDAFVETLPIHRELQARTLEAWLTLNNLDQRGGAVISIETKDGKVFDAVVFGEKQPGKWIAGSNFFARTREVNGPPETKPNELTHVVISYAVDGRISLYRNGVPYGESYSPGGKAIEFKAGETRILIGKRHTGGGSAFFHGEIEETRLYDRALSTDEILASFKAGVERVSREQVLNALSEADRKEHARLEAELTQFRAKLPSLPAAATAYAASIRLPGPTFLLKRGDIESKGEIVTAGPPAAIEGAPRDLALSTDSPEAQRRLRFAEWVTHTDNPLTWRVLVNRVWQHHFGEGIVRSPSDFGFNGERPTHPELLDWLAHQFREDKGSLKKLHRLIMLSATYQQSSKHDPKAAEIDADNRMLWRFAPRRLDAEAVRDAMLAISGQLNCQAGGPSFRPFKIETFNSAFYVLIDVDAPEFNRRSIYRMNVNSARDPVLDTLDCPDPSVKTPRRATTTTPLQALTMMNNSFVQRQARALAERAIKEVGDNLEKQITLVYRFAFGRPPSNLELNRASAVAKEHGLKAVCWAILNASEFVYIR